MPICRWSRPISLRCDYTKNWDLGNFTVTGIAYKTNTACTYKEWRMNILELENNIGIRFCDN
jgi:hypothetical protein